MGLEVKQLAQSKSTDFKVPLLLRTESKAH